MGSVTQPLTSRKNKIPYIVTHDGRTIRFPHPEIEQGDTLKYDLEKGQISTWFKN